MKPSADGRKKIVRGNGKNLKNPLPVQKKHGKINVVSWYWNTEDTSFFERGSRT